MNSITEEELLQFLKAIDEGTVSLQPEGYPQYIYAGNVSYKATNGWRITIFNDCNEWDYVDNVTTADSRSADFNEISEMPTAGEYDPADKVAWRRYGIPGYLLCRCTKCSAVLEGADSQSWPPFLCLSCRTQLRTDRIQFLKTAVQKLQAIDLPSLTEPEGEAGEEKTRKLAQWGICVTVYSLIAHLRKILAGLSPLAEADNLAAMAALGQQLFESAVLTYSLTTEWRSRLRDGGWEKAWQVYGNTWAGDAPQKLPIGIPDLVTPKMIENYDHLRGQNSQVDELQRSYGLIRDYTHAGEKSLLRYHLYEKKGTVLRFIDPDQNPRQASVLPAVIHCLTDLLVFMCELLEFAAEDAVRPKIFVLLQEVERVAPSLQTRSMPDGLQKF
jgi:hypothetical protein